MSGIVGFLFGAFFLAGKRSLVPVVPAQLRQTRARIGSLTISALQLEARTLAIAGGVAVTAASPMLI